MSRMVTINGLYVAESRVNQVIAESLGWKLEHVTNTPNVYELWHRPACENDGKKWAADVRNPDLGPIGCNCVRSEPPDYFQNDTFNASLHEAMPNPRIDAGEDRGNRVWIVFPDIERKEDLCVIHPDRRTAIVLAYLMVTMFNPKPMTLNDYLFDERRKERELQRATDCLC